MARSYIIGFILSVLLTVEAFTLVMRGTFSPGATVIVVLALAIIQLLVQLTFFMHLDRIVKSSYRITSFLFMALVVSIVVFGSLWIMRNLDYNMMSPNDTTEFIRDDEGIK